MTSFNPTASSSTPESSSSPSSLEGGTSGEPRFSSGSVKGIADEAKRAAGGAVTQAKERAAQMAEARKQSAAEHVGRYGTVLRDSARSVEGEDPNVAYFANRAAERIEKVADYVRGASLTRLRQDAEDLARRHPALFFGGLFITGLVVGGLLKSSAKTLRESSLSSSSDGGDDNPYGEPIASREPAESRTASSL